MEKHIDNTDQLNEMGDTMSIISEPDNTQSDYNEHHTKVLKNSLEEQVDTRFKLKPVLQSSSKHFEITANLLDPDPVLDKIHSLDSFQVSGKYVLNRLHRNYTQKIQKWKGHITEVLKEGFVAKLEDLTNQGTDEIGEFDIDDISTQDRSLISVGSVFYWTVGYFIKNGQISKQSLIRFQRLKEWSMQEYDKAIDTAEDLSKKINWD